MGYVGMMGVGMSLHVFFLGDEFEEWGVVDEQVHVGRRGGGCEDRRWRVICMVS